MLIDGELPETEIEQVAAHIADCAECRDLEKDFLFFREQIKDPVFDAGLEQIETPISAARKQNSLWKKGISLPVPVFTIFALVFIGLSAWIVVSKLNQTNENVVVNSIKNSSVKTENIPNETSIARFDKGRRAEIYVAPRTEK